ncbi:MAG TPA: histidine kinase [Bacteroidia bacterium]|nr:histidine kinase [Bacteroidia bacterium]
MKTNIFSKNKTAIPLITWWIFWTIAQTIIIHRLNFTWKAALLDATISNFIIGIAGFVTQSTYKFYNPGKDNRMFRLGYGIALSIICVFLINIVLNQFFIDDKIYLEFIEKSLPIRAVFALLMMSFVTIISWLLYYIEEKQNSTQRKSEAEILLRAAELASLRQQLQPHFLFNSLNSISALAGNKPVEARKMIQLLSDFLRGTLKKEDEINIQLKDEIKHLKLYLEIEKVRFGYRLNTEINVPKNCEELMLPSLVLQPIVENAIKFGLYNTIESIEIIIQVNCKNNMLIIEISNPFDNTSAPSNQGEGFGLKSLQRRLELLYYRKDLLEIEKLGHIFLTRIKIPQSA